MIIAIDGESATGKSTLAKLLSKKLKFKYLNTGMIYRVLTYYLLKNQIKENQLGKIKEALKKIDIKLNFINHNQRIFIFDKDYTRYINLPLVQKNVSKFSKIKAVRQVCLKLQRNFAKNNNIIVEGRDIGSVVYPNANIKFFITCDINVRAKRRFDDLIKTGQNVTLEEVKNDLIARDNNDTFRKESPLKISDGALIIDTTQKTIQQTLEIMIKYIKEKL